MPPICFLEQTNSTPKWFFQKINKTHQKTSKIETNKKKEVKEKVSVIIISALRVAFRNTQSTFTFSKSTVESEKCVKYVQS